MMPDFDMGKHAVFVWGSYGASLLGLAGLILVSLRAHARRKAVLKALQDAAESK
jgi:heme exporter protein CcmD